jgi:CysZ protein
MFKQIGTAISAYGKAFRFISIHNLWIWFLYPVFVFVLLVVGGTALVQHVSDLLRQWVAGFFQSSGSSMLSFVSGALQFIVSIGLKVIFFFLYSAIIKYLVLILLSPVLSMLSRKVDEAITGKKYPFSFSQFVKEILRGSFIAIRNLLFQFLVIAGCFLLMFIPLLGWLAPFFLLFINYYFYGFSMMDYTSGRNKMSVTQSIRFIRKNKGLAIGNGFIFAAVFAIPFIGVVIAPVLSVIAATIVSVEAQKNKIEM